MFDARDGTALPAGGQPLDLAHLARQTFGDQALEREVLGLFLDQAIAVRDELAGSQHAEVRRQLAHGLVGSARAVGAFALADCAAALEASPLSAQLIDRLSALVEEVRLFVAERR